MKKIMIALMLVCGIAGAQERLSFKGLKAYDGDTIKTTLAPLKGITPLSIRVYGIDTPEITGKCDKEKLLARKARDRLNLILKDEITVLPMDWDKYGGRFVATVFDKNGKNVGDILISEGLAVPYFGDKKISNWCK
jgi:micrococcal nuclease